MVAISLYRGNLHRAPDVPRRWLMPSHKISLKDFKSLLARRSKALSRLYAENPNPNPNSDPVAAAAATVQNGSVRVKSEQPAEFANDNGAGPSSKGGQEEEDRKPGIVAGKKPVVDGSDSFVDPKSAVVVYGKAPEPAGDGAAASAGKEIEPVTGNVDLLSEKEKRKKEVEDKLQVLNAKKHNLVLVLKQILSAEEELKRRSSMQGVVMRGPSVPLQADGANDTGSMTRHLAPRFGSEGNLVGDVEGGEADDLANHNVHPRHVLRTSSMSPSSESPLRRTPSVQHNAVAHTSRATLGATGSPSRFAVSGHHGNPTNLPSVSVSGTYIASSPSPAASGGTSVFRDARQPSPWK